MVVLKLAEEGYNEQERLLLEEKAELKAKIVEAEISHEAFVKDLYMVGILIIA
jgi:hypothetical protein